MPGSGSAHEEIFGRETKVTGLVVDTFVGDDDQF